jgi:hypothetical protein
VMVFRKLITDFFLTFLLPTLSLSPSVETRAMRSCEYPTTGQLKIGTFILLDPGV